MEGGRASRPKLLSSARRVKQLSMQLVRMELVAVHGQAIQMLVQFSNINLVLLHSERLPSDRMRTPKVFRRSWGLATATHSDRTSGVLSAVPWLESLRGVRHAEFLVGSKPVATESCTSV